MIFSVAPYLVVPYRPFVGATHKNDTILARCATNPERFLLSACSGDPQTLIARTLTDPANAAWEVWQNDAFIGILMLDHIVPFVDARWQFVFFDDELASKTLLLREFARRCFVELGLQRLTFEAPEHMAVLTGFVRRKLGFAYEGGDRHGSRRERAYCDAEGRWHDVTTLRLLADRI
jgi:hypothetical protein